MKFYYSIPHCCSIINTSESYFLKNDQVYNSQRYRSMRDMPCSVAKTAREFERLREIVVGGGGCGGGGGRRKTTENKAAEESRRRKKNEGAVSWWKLF